MGFDPTNESTEALKKRVIELEERLFAQRAGKKVLLQLLELMQEERREELIRLKWENERLKEKNRRLAKMLITMKWRAEG